MNRLTFAAIVFVASSLHAQVTFDDLESLGWDCSVVPGEQQPDTELECELDYRLGEKDKIRVDFSAAAAHSIRIVAGAGGTNSEYPGGDEPSGGSCSSLTNFAFGDGAGSVAEVGDQFNFSVSGNDDTLNQVGCYGNQASNDMQGLASVPSAYQGAAVENFTGAGLFLREGIAGTSSEWFAHVWLPKIGGVRAKYGSVSTTITSVAGAAGSQPPYDFGFVCDDSADKIYLLESANGGSTWNTIVTIDRDCPDYYGVFGTSHNAAEQAQLVIDDWSYGTTITAIDVGDPPPPPPPPQQRKFDWSCNYESGQLNARSSPNLDCSLGISGVDVANAPAALGITNITKTNPAVITYTGANPSAGEGMLINGVNGMTQVNGQLVYVKNLNTGAKTFEAAVTNWPLWTGNGGLNLADLIGCGMTQACLQMNSTTYGNYSGPSGTLQRFAPVIQAGNGGGWGPASGFRNRVITTGVDSIGTSTSVPCREGTYCFRSEIHYNWPNFSNSKNKPRMGMNPPSAAHYDWNVPFWTGISIYVPQDACTDTGSSQQGNSVYTVSGDGASQDMLQLRFGRPSPNSTVNNWTVSISVNTQSGNQNTIGTFVLAEATKGKWHDFVIYQDANAFTGDVIIWHNTSDGNGDSGTVPVKVYEKLNGYGNLPIAGSQVRPDFRQYYYTWKHQTTTCQQNAFAVGFDSFYTGSVAGGTTSSDVHPGRQSVTGGPSP